MNIFISDDEILEIPIIIDNSEDKGNVILPTIGERGEGKDDITKEIIANDSLELGPVEAARIHGVTAYSATRYSHGNDISNEDVKTRVLANKHNIADLAVTKLMESLNLFDPSTIEKPIDQIKAAGVLANVVEKLNSEGKNGKGNQVILNLYAPKQRMIKEFEVIEVN